jgi:DNA repair protein RecN (Recombination protein N)
VNEGLEEAVSALRQGSLLLDRTVAMEPELNGHAEVLTRLLSELEDTTYALARHQTSLEGPEMTLEQLDDRLHAYKGAARKHHVLPQELHATWETLQAEQATLADLSGHIVAAEKALKETRKVYEAACAALTDKRHTAAPKLVGMLTPHLRALNLPHAVFSVDFPAITAAGFGGEEVMFMFSANTGQPLQPLGKVASGGELSRVLLALKAVTYGNQPGKTIVLDEADTGIGGATAAAVGAAMAQLAQVHQVLTITHHPQVAAHATQHLKISKLSTETTTRTSVVELSADSRVEELARMLAGQIVTEEARRAAQNLLVQSRQPVAA